MLVVRDAVHRSAGDSAAGHADGPDPGSLGSDPPPATGVFLIRRVLKVRVALLPGPARSPLLEPGLAASRGVGTGYASESGPRRPDTWGDGVQNWGPEGSAGREEGERC